MSVLFKIIVSTVVISLISLVGVFVLAVREKFLNKILFVLVALSAGALTGGAFLHLLPEALEDFDPSRILLYVLASFVLFFLIEKILHWRHCHKGHCEIHTFGYINLVGDAAHNLIDGLIIAAAFVANPALGISTVVAVALHEIPQEIGDFGVLVYAGIKKTRALFYNFLIALTAVGGGLAGFYLIGFTEKAQEFLLPFAAGGFIYIAFSDLIPEIRKETKLSKSIASFVVFLAGIGLMYLLKFAE